MTKAENHVEAQNMMISDITWVDIISQAKSLAPESRFEQRYIFTSICCSENILSIILFLFFPFNLMIETCPGLFHSVRFGFP